MGQVQINEINCVDKWNKICVQTQMLRLVIYKTENKTRIVDCAVFVFTCFVNYTNKILNI